MLLFIHNLRSFRDVTIISIVVNPTDCLTLCHVECGVTYSAVKLIAKPPPGAMTIFSVSADVTSACSII